MAKPEDWNAAVMKGVEVTSTLQQGLVSVGTAAVALASALTNIDWVIIQNISAVNIFIGGSTVTATGSTTGLRVGPNGNSPILKVDDLSTIFVIAASGSGNSVLFLAGSP